MQLPNVAIGDCLVERELEHAMVEEEVIKISRQPEKLGFRAISLHAQASQGCDTLLFAFDAELAVLDIVERELA